VADVVAPVVVDTDGIEGPGDDGEVTVAHMGQVAHRGEIIEHVVRVPAPQQRLIPEAVDDAVHPPYCVQVLGPLPCRHDRIRVDGDADLRVGSHHRPQRIHGQAVTEQQVVRGANRRPRLSATRGMDAGAVAQHGCAPRFVDRGPAAHPIAQCGTDESGVGGEAQGGVASRPAAGILEGLRQVPVVERQDGLDAGFEQRVHQCAVEVETRTGSGS